MITGYDFLRIVSLLGQQGQDDIAWSEACCAPTSADDFASEAIFVICNSGMKNTIAVKIFAKVIAAIRGGTSVFAVFGHPGKAKAIDDIWRRRDELLAQYLAAADKVAFCETLPWIGGITKYHLAKNFGADVAKPDVHLQRLADREGVTPQRLCERLAQDSGYKIATVDVLLWRACADGVINSRTGEING
ncbi:hypothetical protein [Mesorhizobium sp.]|uniref:hypothetical protein n=1 Tax=Mesorhizobium sp. TaxID=1871066 RepID=UPI0011F80ABA|nr:hypothetical protein [Mesorhizobium sp.]TIX28895.1 MAG: hypothetical protein E5V35_00610 [Mesorhizobium sp.]